MHIVTMMQYVYIMYIYEHDGLPVKPLHMQALILNDWKVRHDSNVV